MDVTVRPMPGGKGWSLIDLLGRSMGRITEDPPKHFTIYPDGHATETMAGLSPGPTPRSNWRLVKSKPTPEVYANSIKVACRNRQIDPAAWNAERSGGS